jgi:hypothetical protein
MILMQEFTQDKEKGDPMGNTEYYVKEMYKGEELRDASSKIRGFIYQDLLAVELLVKSEDDTEELYVEWAEDLYLESRDFIKIIQVKYYHSKDIEFDEIYNELFYQFLRLQTLQCKKDIICQLTYYNQGKSKNMCNHDHIESMMISPCEQVCNAINDKNWLEENVYLTSEGKARNKQGRERIVLTCLGKKEKRNNFINLFKEDLRIDQINEFRIQLKKDIMQLIDSNGLISSQWNRDILASVCLATAVSYIQEAYDEKNQKERGRKRTPQELRLKFQQLINCGMTDESIILLLQSYVDEVHEDDILPSITLIGTDEETIQKNKHYLKLRNSTIDFLQNNLKTEKDQQKLLNTISCEKGINYCGKLISDRHDVWKEHKDKFKGFIRNIWKILFDIECDEFTHYLDREFEDYLLFLFPILKGKKAVVLSEVATSDKEGSVNRVFQRYRSLETEKRPDRWFFRTLEFRGIGDYEIDTTRISEHLENNAAYCITSGEKFILECMECIRLEKYYGDRDQCETCIFANDCVKENEHD